MRFTHSNLNSFIVRKATFADVNALVSFYLSLPESMKASFHPFPFRKNRVKAIFLAMIVGQLTKRILTKLAPRMLCGLVVVIGTESRIVGFAFFKVTGNSSDGRYVANAGPIVAQEAQGTGISKMMYLELIELARLTDVGQFRITIIEKNIRSAEFHKNMGFKKLGETKLDFWAGHGERNSIWELNLQ